MFRDLARASRHNVLVACVAALRVVSRTEPIRCRFDLLIEEAVVVEGSAGNDIVFVEAVERWTLREESVGYIVEASGRLSGRARWTLRVNRAIMAEAEGTCVITPLIAICLALN